MTDTLVNRIISLAKSQPDRLAAAFKKESLSYRQLCQRMFLFSARLRREGIQKGERVAFCAVSKPEMIVAYLGIQHCGAVAVFLDKNASPASMYAIYKEADAKLLLTDKSVKEYAQSCRVLSLKEMCRDEDDVQIREEGIMKAEENQLAELLFTTGTTGKPKGVMLTYKAVYNILANTIEGIGIRPDDILLLPLPLNHSFALRVLRAVLYRGASLVLQNGFTFAKEVENNIMRYGCNAMACVPASYQVMRSQMQDNFERVLGKMRYIEFGAGSLSVKERYEITRLLPDTLIYNTWGSSETGGAIFCHVSEEVKRQKNVASLGKPLSGKVEVRILDSDGNVMEKSDAAHPGRMIVRGDMQMAGYWNNPSATELTLRDGWLLTGDMAYINEDGYVFMLGRADDLINVGGEKVSPVEVENTASQYDEIRECACVGVKDPNGVLGQVPVLFVVAKSGFDENEMVRFLSSRLERYKLPAEYIRLESLPRNRMQKIDRSELKMIWDNRDARNLINPVMQNILSRRSIRKFKEQEIPKSILEMILKAGYYAPSGHNMQSWRFTVLTKQTDILKLKEVSDRTARENHVHFYGFENPTAVVLISNDNRNPDGCQDASCAAENMMLAANSYGIGSVWINVLMTLRQKEPAKSMLDEFGIPGSHTVWASLAFGYPVSDGVFLQKKADVVYYI